MAGSPSPPVIRAQPVRWSHADDGTAYQQPENHTMSEYGVALTLARYRAKQLVRQQLWDRGIKLQSVTARDVIGSAEDYIAEHPELLAEAVETVRSSPELQRIVRSSQRFGAKLSSDAQRKRR
jgi:hypothetical protein